MILYVGLKLLTCLIAYGVDSDAVRCPAGVLRKEAENKVRVTAIFTLLFVVSAIREAVGNDYGEYLQIFDKISGNVHVSTEIGFNAVVRICQYFFGTGEVSARIILGLFSFGTVYFLVKALYDQSTWFVMSFFLLMTQGFYFNSLNTVRYYFVLAVALYSMKYAQEKKWIRFVLLILFAALFHKTVLLVLPVYFLAGLSYRLWHLIPVGVLCLSAVLFPEFYRTILFKIYPFYENSAYDTGGLSYVNILKCLCVLILSILYYRQAIKDDRVNRFYFMLNIGALLIYCFGSFIPVVSRVAFYLSISNVFLIAGILKRIPDKKQKIFFTGAVILAFSLYFAAFLYKAYDINIRLLPYHSFVFE